MGHTFIDHSFQVKTVARIIYGNTWWGEQWLKALTHIDYDNRLPRGRSYANKGAVKDLKLSDGTLRAKVQGSRPTPYQVTIQVPPLNEKQVNRLLDALLSDPGVIARLLNRDLSPSVLNHAQDLGIPIFPTRWKDLTMKCTCPDWAVPCKHLAAAIYLLSREIDNHPFLIFSLRGLELTSQLKARGIHIERETKVTLPSFSALLGPLQGEALPSVDPLAFDQLDYASLPELSESLLAVLPASSAFFPHGDLRGKIQKALARSAKFARKALDGAGWTPSADGHLLQATHRPRITFSHDGFAVVSGVNAMHGISQLDAALAQLAPADLWDRQPEVAALYHIRLMALHLLSRGAVVPQVFAVEPEVLGVRWLPAMLDAEIAKQVGKLATGIPLELATVLSAKQLLAPEMQAISLCAVFLNEYIRAWSDFAMEKPSGDKLLSLLFSGVPQTFNAPGEHSIGPALVTWLARFHLSEREHVPVISLAETEHQTFWVSLAVHKRAEELKPPTPLNAVLREAAWDEARFGILQTVVLLAEFFPQLDGYLRQQAITPIAVTLAELPGLLFDTLPALRLLGIRVLLPKVLEKLLRPRLSMEISSQAPGISGNQLNMEALFSFDWRIALGEYSLTREEFEQLVNGAADVVRFKGEYVYLNPAAIARLQAQFAQTPSLSNAELLRTALAGEFAGTPVVLDESTLQHLARLREAGEVALPADLQATLRPYQTRGYAWLFKNLQIGFGSVLADDMGLGKTLQVITTLLKLKQEGALASAKALVVMPTSLLTNWQKEIQRFAPGLTVGVFHGSKRELASERPDVLLTTYGIARSAATTLRAMAWKVLIVDEAQNIKNPAAAQTRALKSIPAASCIAMSGTPVENRLSEYWSIMDFVNRGYLGSLKQFEREFTTPIQIDRDHQVAERFRRVTAPFLMRRLKSDRSIISDLPSKMEQNQYCALTAKQTALYESVVREGLKTLSSEGDHFKRQGLVLQMILTLKQICNHPDQYLKQTTGDPFASGKLARLFDLLDDLYASHEKALIFTQFREMGELLARWIDNRYGHEPMFLHGGVSRAQRDRMVERFQTDRTERVFLLSLKAGGTGLNLTAASNVIHFDLWWNPAVEAQATDRAYRIGQQRNVQVHRFVTNGTFEEKINEMIQQKRELAELAVTTGEQWIGQLPQSELQALFELKSPKEELACT